jgi:hypothetical protein
MHYYWNSRRIICDGDIAIALTDLGSSTHGEIKRNDGGESYDDDEEGETRWSIGRSGICTVSRGWES